MDVLPLLDQLTLDQRRRLATELAALVSERRLARIDEVLARRTRHLTVLFVDTHHPHNASAAMRTCECFGIQDVHVVEETTTFRPSRDVVRGAGRWLTLHRHARLVEATAELRRRGYALAAASLSKESQPLDELTADGPLALALGSEERGFAEHELALFDQQIHVPMRGFTESLNVSVTAALCLHHLTRTRPAAADWSLAHEERDELRLRWLCQEGNKGRAVAVRLLREWGLVSG